MNEPYLKGLSPEARELIDRAKSGQDPTSADQERVLSALQARIAAGEADPQHAASSPEAAAKPWALISAGGIGAALIAATMAWRLAPVPAPKTPSAAPPPALAPAEPVAPLGPSPEIEPSPPPPPTDLPRAPSSSGKPTSRLAEEVEILSRATSALHAGRAQDALSDAAEHQKKFPGGVLSEERRSVRAQALCLLGRTSEAKRELVRLSPASPHAARARQRCGALVAQ